MSVELLHEINQLVYEKTECDWTQNSKDDGKKGKEPHIVAHKEESVGYDDKANTLKNEIIVINVQRELMYIVKPSIDSFDLFLQQLEILWIGFNSRNFGMN